MIVTDVIRESSRRTRTIVIGCAGLLAAAVALSLTHGVSGDRFWGNVPLSLVSAILAVGTFVLATSIPQEIRARRNAILLALGIAAYAVGDIVWLVYELGFGIDAPYPGLPDLFYGPALYVPMTLALWGMVKSMWQLDRAHEPVIVAALVSMLVFITIWFTLLVPVLSADSAGTFEKLVSVAYPIADVFLLFMPTVALVVVLVRLGGEALAHPWLPVVLSTLVMAVADAAYAWFQAHGLYVGGSWLDVTWLFAFALITVSVARMLDVYGTRDE